MWNFKKELHDDDVSRQQQPCGCIMIAAVVALAFYLFYFNDFFK